MTTETSPSEPAAVPGAGACRRAVARVPWDAAALVGLLAAGCVLLIYLGRGTSFFFDEWDWIQGRRGWSLDSLLTPHNAHLSLLPVLVLKLLFSTLGLESYLPYRVMVLTFHLGVVVLLYVYARRRAGALVALGAAVSLLFLGPAWMDLLWALQVGYLGSLLCGLGALLALDRADRRGDVVAMVLLSAALASSSLGLPCLGAVALEVLGRPDRRTRCPVVAAPAALYGAWYLAYGTASEVTVDNLFATPSYTADAAAAAVAALFGLSVAWGPPLAVALLGLLALAIRRGVVVPWRLAALGAAPLMFWGLTGLGRADLHEPGASRYLYPGVLLILLLAVEAARERRPSPRALAVVGVLLAAATVSNVGELRDGGRWLRGLTTEVRGALTATEIGGTRLPPRFQPAPDSAPQIRAGPYLAAVADYGSPASTPAALRGDEQPARHAADDTLLRGYALALSPEVDALSPAESDPTELVRVEEAHGVSVVPRAGCVEARSEGAGAIVTVVAPPGGLVIENVSSVRLRRWSDTFSEPIAAPADAAGPLALMIPVDDDPTPWKIELPVEGVVTACPLVT